MEIQRKNFVSVLVTISVIFEFLYVMIIGKSAA